MLGLTIRRARGVDAPALARLYRDLVPDTRVNVDAARVDTLANDPHTYLFVCESEGVVCGTALLTLCMDVMYGHQPFGLVENVVVDPAMRNRGIGSQLMASIEQHCRQQECSKIMLVSAAERVDAHRFFERHGFATDVKRAFVKYRRDWQLHAPTR